MQTEGGLVPPARRQLYGAGGEPAFGVGRERRLGVKGREALALPGAALLGLEVECGLFGIEADLAASAEGVSHVGNPFPGVLAPPHRHQRPPDSRGPRKRPRLDSRTPTRRPGVVTGKSPRRPIARTVYKLTPSRSATVLMHSTRSWGAAGDSWPLIGAVRRARARAWASASFPTSVGSSSGAVSRASAAKSVLS